MKKEINMRKELTKKEKGSAFNLKADSAINTDPYGSYTGVSTDNKYERPIQDADDL